MIVLPGFALWINGMLGMVLQDDRIPPLGQNDIRRTVNNR